MAYTKLFQKILASSIWTEDMATRLVWITFLAMKDQNHIVYGSVGGIANIARVSHEQCATAIKKFESPDPDDSSGVREGQRIERLANGGWLIINGKAYRDSKDEDERRAYMAAYMRNYRLRRKEEDEERKQIVNNRKPLLAPVNPSDQIIDRSDTEQINISPNGSKDHDALPRGSRRPKDWKEFLDYCLAHGCTKEQATYYFATWQANDWTTKGKPIKDWKAKVISWRTAGYGPRTNEKRS